MPLGRLIEFIPGTKAEAGEVNYNFNTVKSFVDGLEVNLTDVTNDIAQLETSKANTNGDYRVRFSVADPLNNYDAVNLQSFNKRIGNSINVIYGLGITKVGDNTIMVSAGTCYDSTLDVIMELSEEVSKTNSTQGANTTYYVYLIAKEDGSTDVLIVQNATNPPLPSEYVYYRLIGSYTTNEDNVIVSVTNTQITQANDTSSFVQSNYEAIAISLMPDYSKGRSLSTGGVTVAESGWIFSQYGGDSGGFNVYVDGAQVFRSGAWGSYSNTNQGAMAPVPAGGKITTSGGGGSITFYPCKGGA